MDKHLGLIILSLIVVAGVINANKSMKSKCNILCIKVIHLTSIVLCLITQCAVCIHFLITALNLDSLEYVTVYSVYIF